MITAQRDILEHCLEEYRGYRNNFVVQDGTSYYNHCLKLVEKGYMTYHGWLDKDSMIFAATQKGIDFINCE